MFCKLELAIGEEWSSQRKTAKGALSEVLGVYSSGHREGMNPRVPAPAHARVQHLSQAWEWGICEIKSEMHQVAFTSQLLA